MKRRDFVKTMALSGIAVAASDVIADLIAQSPSGRVLESKFKGLSDVALMEARRGGCTYADIRFTRSTSRGVNANGGNRDADDLGGFGGAAAAGVAVVAGAAAAGAGSVDSAAAMPARAPAAAMPPGSACA